MFDKNHKPIYTSQIPRANVERIKQQFEHSEFKNMLGKNATDKERELFEAKKEFAAGLYANKQRISNLTGVSPLNEDAKIFGGLGVDTKLFESASLPSNIIGLGNVVSPDPSHAHKGGQWNPAYKAGSGDIPSYVFGLQTEIAFRCVGFELVPTIAVDTPKVPIIYVDKVYGGGTFDDAANMPSFITLTNKLFTADWLANADIKRGATKFYISSSDGAKVLECVFNQGSTVGTKVVVEVLSTGKLSAAPAATVTYTKENEHSVAEVLTAVGTTGSLLYKKVSVPATFQVVALSAATKADYASMDRTPIAEASTNTGSSAPMNRKEHERGVDYKINIIAFDKQVEIEGYEINADTTNIQIRDFAAMGINVIAMLYESVQGQLIQSIDEQILTRLYRLGCQHAYDAKMSQGIDHSLFIAQPSTPNLAYTDIKVPGFVYENMLGDDIRGEMGNIPNSILSSQYENQMTHAERLTSRILLVADFIGHQNRVGGPDWIVVNGEIASTLKKHSSYVTRPIPTTMSAVPTMQNVGTIFGDIVVYKNPKTSFNDPRILLGRKGTDSDSGCKLLAYDLAASRQTIAEGTMAEKIKVWSRFTLHEVGFYPQLNYYTMVAVNKMNWA